MSGLIYRRLLPTVAFVFAISASQAQLASMQPPADAFNTAALTSPQQSAPATATEIRGDLLMDRARYQEAIRTYASVEPPNSVVWDKMGLAYQMLYDLDGAKRCYKQALKLDQANIHALNNLATLFDSLKQFSAAESAYKQALRIDPSSAMLLRNYGTSLIMRQQYGRGTDLYAQALAIDPHILDQTPAPKVYAASSIHDCGAENYLQARSCARAGLADCALSHLRQAFNEGTATLQRVAGDDDFDTLRAKPAFQTLLAEQK